MTHYTNEAVQPVNQQLIGVAQRLRDAGATLPAPQVGGTIESAMNHGLCIALALVEEAIAAAPQLSGNSGQLPVIAAAEAAQAQQPADGVALSGEVIELAQAVIDADRAGELTDDLIDKLDAAIAAHKMQEE